MVYLLLACCFYQKKIYFLNLDLMLDMSYEFFHKLAMRGVAAVYSLLAFIEIGVEFVLVIQLPDITSGLGHQTG